MSGGLINGLKIVIKNDAPRQANAARHPITTIFVCLVLVVITWAVFAQTLRYDFINFDDPKYVLKNREIQKGLSVETVAWAVSHSHSYNWHPLTTLTHEADCQFYGLNAGRHHLTNVLLHSLGVLLLFVV